MGPVIVKVDDRLAETGDTLPVSGHLEEDSYSLGDHVFELPEGIDYDLMLTNAGEGILATGILRAHVVGTCDRCLKEAAFDVSSEVDGYYVFEPQDGDVEADDEDDDEASDVYPVGEDDTIDLSPALSCSLIMETPYVVLCRPDCKGLCPTCGANLNDGPCGCDHAAADEPLTASPFAALASLHLDAEGPADAHDAEDDAEGDAAGAGQDGDGR
ncbi:MAG: DUF177 domain-containing protein [Atopobiaceae bacterium]|jgi:uncharacterized protein|nr:DUF177 domain-containing protein [Atopobiaceae bacterium]MCH4120472.1 DUF177 domain-containing protein [Atopobiaceae bacterium]MCI1388310.1 DUF177 domain-containing protein [Atopobiaceae bacterium]MCI1431440.1 DUF177 domain-containing protein [Atopobiaceae bacterium]MCI1469876.1 DUF177 domain-containing protein [Atopobiaceae bacterium]